MSETFPLARLYNVEPDSNRRSGQTLTGRRKQIVLGFVSSSSLDRQGQRDARTSLDPVRALVTALAVGGFLPPVLTAQGLEPELVRARCEAVHEIEDQAILFGEVVDGQTGTMLPGSTVHLSWTMMRGAGDSTIHRTQTRSDDGRYIFCDVPQDTRLYAWADGMGGSSERAEFFFGGGESMRHDLALTVRSLTGGISGVVVDATTGEPIESATVSFPARQRSALTDADGRFRLRDLPIGTHEAMIEHVAYGQPRLQVAVERALTTFVTVELAPVPIAVEPISVTVSQRRQWLEAKGFYERQDSNLGQFVTPEEIAIRPWRRFSEVLRSVPGVELRDVCTPHCAQLIRMAASSVSQCVPTFYVDGRRINVRPDARSRWEPRGLIDLDALAVGSDLAAVEVYRSIAETPAQFYGRCGSIVIWTKRGAG